MRFSVHLAVMLVCLILVHPVRAETMRVAPADVSGAIARAKAYLYSQQNADGNWETRAERKTTDTSNDTEGGQWGGLTSIACYALLASGESHQDPKLSKAIAFLKKAEIVGVYALGMRCQVWSFLPRTPEIKQLLAKDAQLLFRMMKTDKANGFYDYTFSKDSGYSLSRSQYAVLGMWTCAQAGVEIRREYWETVEQAWLGAQKPDGGWNYKSGGKQEHPETPGMTAVGVATLFITQDFLYGNKGVDCKGNITNQAIEKGMNWIESNIAKVASDEKYERDYPLATLYAIERIGVASGAKYFGKVDWFEHGAAWLIKKQKNDGSWYGGASFIGSVADTCFATLFLSRGRAPVAFNKLDYSTAGGVKKVTGWNQRPRDIANLTRWIGRQIEADLNWQIVTIDSPVADWHDARVMYISGKDEVVFSDDEAAKLKRYVEEGGMILAHADCAGRGFATSMRKLGERLFPPYEWRELPPTHVIYTEQQFRRDKWKTKPGVLGVSNGCRELMLLIPQADAGKTWQMGNAGGREELFQVGADVFQYAVDKNNLLARGERFVVQADENVKPDRTITIARLRMGANPNPEPGGWRRLSAILHNRGVNVEVSDCDPAKETIAKNAKIAHLTGTTSLAGSNAAMPELARFVKNGGTLIVDAAGGSIDFSTSVEALLSEAFKGIKLETIPADDAIFGGLWKDAGTAYRRYATKSNGASSKSPRVRGMKMDGRWGVIFSPDDITCGLTGAPVDGIVGYTPETATKLMIRLVDSAEKLPKEKVAPAPAVKSKKKTGKRE